MAELVNVVVRLTDAEFSKLCLIAQQQDRRVDTVATFLVREGLSGENNEGTINTVANRVEENSDLIALEKAGYRLMPKSISEVKEFQRGRTCFICDHAGGDSSEWAARGRFADYEELETGRVLKRVICEDHARKFGR